MKTTVNTVLRKIELLNDVIETLRMGQTVDWNLIADHLEEYLDLLRKLPVEI